MFAVPRDRSSFRSPYKAETVLRYRPRDHMKNGVFWVVTPCTPFFIVTAVKTSNLTRDHMLSLHGVLVLRLKFGTI
jgi:hypothetical protein